MIRISASTNPPMEEHLVDYVKQLQKFAIFLAEMDQYFQGVLLIK